MAAKRARKPTQAERKAPAKARAKSRSKAKARAKAKSRVKAKTRGRTQKATGKRGAGVSFDEVREIALALPGSEESTSYGTPAFKVKGKLFLRLHDQGEWLVVKIDFDDREAAMAADPKTYFITDNYKDHPMMLVHMEHVRPAALAELVEASWRRSAPPRLLADYANR